MKNIAIPIGISDFAAHTLRYGFDLAHYFGATVYLIDAYPPRSTGSSHMQNIHALAEEKMWTGSKPWHSPTIRKLCPSKFCVANKT